MFENGAKLPQFVKWGVLNSPEDDRMGAVLKITPGHNILHHFTLYHPQAFTEFG